MSQNTIKRMDSVLPNEQEETIPSLKLKDNFEVLKIGDLFQRSTDVNQLYFNVSQRVRSRFNIDFEFMEHKNIQVNQFEFFELVYKIVEETITEIQNVEVDNFEDLMVYNFKTLPLHLPPTKITEEEMEWSQRVMNKRDKDVPFGSTVIVPEESHRYFLINLRRLMDKNKSNPIFNDSVITFFENN